MNIEMNRSFGPIGMWPLTSNKGNALLNERLDMVFCLFYARPANSSAEWFDTSWNEMIL